MLLKLNYTIALKSFESTNAVTKVNSASALKSLNSTNAPKTR